MRLAFTDEQNAFRDAVREFLQRECGAAVVRAAWSGATSPLWGRLAAMGVTGMTAPEALGGLGLNGFDLVLVLEEAGRAALPEPLLETTAVAVPLLAELGAARWVRAAAAGEALITVALDRAPLPAHADRAHLLIVQRGDQVHAVERGQANLTAQPSVDGARRLFRADFTPSSDTLLAEGDAGRAALAAAGDRAALAAAAELCGIAAHLIDTTVEYAKVRQQFGKPIGSFQAVKHQLADALLGLEMARPVVYRAAWSLATAAAQRSLHASMAKAFASDAATRAARAALQCHGAIGYSFEHDLHLWMKRGWALAAAWGDAAWHRARIAAEVLDAPRLPGGQ